MSVIQADSGSSAVLKIQINIKGQQDREVVKKCTYKGFEVVEVNGAVFYRKRKSSVNDPQAAAAKRPQQGEVHEDAGQPAPATTAQHADVEDGAAGEDAACAAGAVGMEQQFEAARDCCMDPAEGACAAEEALLHPAPEDLEPEDLKAQLDSCLPTGCPKALAMQFYLERLLLHGASDLDHSHATPVYSQAARRVLGRFGQLLQQQAELAGSLLLHARSSMPAQSSSVSDDSAPPQQQAGAAAAGAAADAAAPDSPLERYVRLAPMIRELTHSSALKAHLQQQLGALGQEEEAWAKLRHKYREAGTARPAELPGVAPQPEAPQQAPAAASELSLLKRTEQSVNAALTLQVESLAAFLSKVDAMVAKGEQACMMLQADYHQQKFKTFPHVNSPAWLIRQIISKQQSLTTLEAGEGPEAVQQQA